MAGATFVLGQEPTRPGVYVRITNIGELPALIAPQGIVGAVFQATWGPLGLPQDVMSLTDVDTLYGTGLGTDILREALRGGTQLIRALRLGLTGSSTASITLKDSGGSVSVLTLNAKYPGTRGGTFGISLANALGATGYRDLNLYEGTALLETFRFPAGATTPVQGTTTSGEVYQLAAAVNAGSSYITATVLLPAETSSTHILGTVAVASGDFSTVATDPTASNAAYVAALKVMQAETFGVFVTDSEDADIIGTRDTAYLPNTGGAAIEVGQIQDFVTTARSGGKRIIAVVGQKPGSHDAANPATDLTKRLADATWYNNMGVVFVANGFTSEVTTPATVQGAMAAARVAGMIAAQPLTSSLTNVVVLNTSDLVGSLASDDIEAALSAGALVFSLNSRKEVRVEQGITTFTKPDANYDLGWAKIRRTRTRDYLIDAIAGDWETLVGRINNDANGRGMLVARARAIIDRMIRDGALIAGTIVEDAGHPPQVDMAWFICNVDDLDSLERQFVTFGFRWSPPIVITT